MTHLQIGILSENADERSILANPAKTKKGMVANESVDTVGNNRRRTYEGSRSAERIHHEQRS